MRPAKRTTCPACAGSSTTPDRAAGVATTCTYCHGRGTVTLGDAEAWALVSDGTIADRGVFDSSATSIDPRARASRGVRSRASGIRTPEVSAS